MKVGIIGIGKLGSIHLRIYRELNQISKVYIVESAPEKLKEHNDIEGFSNYRDLLGKVDLVSIATPTFSHFEIAKFFLENKIPTFVEKPIAQNIKEANQLIAIAKKNKTLLFVGHVERYNNAYLTVKDFIKNPLFIECHRLSLYPNRSLDISVVLDLMIHDLDIILDLAQDKIKKIDTKGVNVLSSSADIANVRLTFQKGCVANITASRISAKKERKVRIFMANCYISIDYAEQMVEMYRKDKNQIIKENIPIIKEEPLKKEIIDFVNLAKHQSKTCEFAIKARNALALALKIQTKIS